MLYPVILHKDEDSCFGATMLDFPGCFTAGDTMEEALANVQDAVELWMDDVDELPDPTPLEKAVLSEEAEGGAVVLFDLDLAFLDRRAKRINITVPSYALAKIDRAAKKAGQSRSEFLVNSALRYTPKRAAV